MSIINEIISNIWFFQTESVVPLFQEISLMILFIFIVSSAVMIFGGAALSKNKQRIIIGFVLYPILIIIFYFLLVSFGNYFGFDLSQISISQTIDNAIKYWWVFFVFWPIVLIGLLFKLIGNKSEAIKNVVPIALAPIYEEFAFRFIAINTIFLLTNSIEISLLFSAIAFSIIHLLNKYEDGWGGPVTICTTLIGGIAWGIIAINFGLILAIAVHMVHNIISKLVGKWL